MERVAEPLPALACTTSVPPSWVRRVSLSPLLSSQLNVGLGLKAEKKGVQAPFRHPDKRISSLKRLQPSSSL